MELIGFGKKWLCLLFRIFLMKGVILAIFGDLWSIVHCVCRTLFNFDRFLSASESDHSIVKVTVIRCSLCRRVVAIAASRTNCV